MKAEMILICKFDVFHHWDKHVKEMSFKTVLGDLELKIFFVAQAW